jgi:diaminopimelate decarboxylase
LEIPKIVFETGEPFFLYSEEEMKQSAQSARKFWSHWSLPGFEIFYSVKVNPNPYLLSLMTQWVDGFDVSSLSEARLVKKMGLLERGSKMTWSGPAKTDRALDEVRDWGLRCFHLDSVEEWKQFQRRKIQAPYSLRLSTSGLHTQKLGFSRAELEALNKLEPRAGTAVHAYLGRETFSEKSWSAFQERLKSATEAGFVVSNPDIFLGAGLPSRSLLEKHLASLRPNEMPSRILHLESGRGLIQSAGWYGTQILSIKVDSPSSNVIIDGGLQHLASHFLSPRFKDDAVEIRFFRKGVELQDRTETVSLHGSLSLWHDMMIENISAPAGLRRGDWIVANHVGAYGYSAASNQFLGPSRVKEWLLRSDQSIVDISAPHLRSYDEAAR